MIKDNHLKLTKPYVYILILSIISLLISVIGVCILPRIGRVGLLQLLCMGILMIYVSIILGFSAWKSVNYLKTIKLYV